ncbi:hypothetical protein ISN44_As08g013050 [Arabidopsis suecica]|uniref:Uncharacterized protein n=1 Tax=Arabidopsis suecica TaxID=45249 RepID=A0A8T2B6Q0_ARASU|nr:hypothetical protein ISN44_As08g013050 [Arabidopsis suecica]
MEGNKLRVAKLKKERLRKSLMKAESKASDILSFTLSWRDLESHFDSIESDLVKRSQELESKEKHLEKRSHELESKGKILEKRAREIDTAYGFRREKLNRDRKIELKRTREQVEALQKNDMKQEVEHFTGKSCKEMSEELQVQQEKYEEILKKKKSEEKKLRSCTRDLAQREGDLRWVSMRLSKRCEELGWEKRKMNVLRKRNDEAERKLQHLNRALEEKQKEVDSIEKRLRECRNVKGRGNSDTSGDE